MESIYVILCAVAIPLFTVWQPFDGRYHLFALGTAAFLFAWVFSGPVFYVSDMPFFIMCLWFSLTSAWSTCPRESWIDVLNWISLFVLYMAARRLPPEMFMLALFVPIVPIGLLAIYQQYSRVRYGQVVEVKGKKLMAVCSGVFYNSNHGGVYFTISFFVSLWLARQVSPLFYIAAGVLAILVYFTKCRSAWIGLGAGLCVASFYFFADTAREVYEAILLITVISAVFYRMFARKKGDIGGMSRKGFLVTVANTIRQRPVFGWGLRTYRREQFYSFINIHKRWPEISKKYLPAVTHRVHNDYLEIWHETGVIGLGLFLYLLWGLPYSADPVLAGGLIAVMVIGLFFYPFREPHLAVSFWCMAGALTGPPSGPAQAIPLPVYAVLITAFAALAYRYAYKKLLALHYLHSRPDPPGREGNIRLLKKCLIHDPYNTMYLAKMYQASHADKPALALQCAVRMSEHFDGNVIYSFVQSVQPKIQADEK